MTLYGYGARRIKKRSFGRFSMARTTRFKEDVEVSQLEMVSRNSSLETRNTVIAPVRALEYEIAAPVHGPKVYPDKIMSVEYSGMGAGKGQTIVKDSRVVHTYGGNKYE
jgi:hypothetical protein